MRSHSTLSRLLSATACIAALLGMSFNAVAEGAAEKLSSDNHFAAKVYGDSHNVSVANAPGTAQSMRVAGPNGYFAESRSMSLPSSKPMADGLYKYEVIGALASNNARWDAKSNRENGRSEKARPGPAFGVIATGTFRIVNGTVFEPGDETEEQASEILRAQPADSHQHDSR